MADCVTSAIPQFMGQKKGNYLVPWLTAFTAKRGKCSTLRVDDFQCKYPMKQICVCPLCGGICDLNPPTLTLPAFKTFKRMSLGSKVTFPER